MTMTDTGSFTEDDYVETEKQVGEKDDVNAEENEDDLHKLLVPRVEDLPLSPTSAVDSNFVAYFAPGLWFNYKSVV